MVFLQAPAGVQQGMQYQYIMPASSGAGSQPGLPGGAWVQVFPPSCNAPGGPHSRAHTQQPASYHLQAHVEPTKGLAFFMFLLEI